MKVNGTKYQTPCALVVGKDEAEELEFRKVENIYVYENLALFEFIPLLTRQFNRHHHTFVLAMPPISVRSKYLIMVQFNCVGGYIPKLPQKH